MMDGHEVTHKFFMNMFVTCLDPPVIVVTQATAGLSAGSVPCLRTLPARIDLAHARVDMGPSIPRIRLLRHVTAQTDPLPLRWNIMVHERHPSPQCMNREPGTMLPSGMFDAFSTTTCRAPENSGDLPKSLPYALSTGCQNPLPTSIIEPSPFALLQTCWAWAGGSTNRNCPSCDGVVSCKAPAFGFQARKWQTTSYALQPGWLRYVHTVALSTTRWGAFSRWRAPRPTKNVFSP